MYKPADMSIWDGRIDDDKSEEKLRWHQYVQAWDGKKNLENATALLGFICDEGVRRNHGRVGAKHGPKALRKALNNLSYTHSSAIFDAGNVICENQVLEQTQENCADIVCDIIQKDGHGILLGGGHEVTWGGLSGLEKFYKSEKIRPSLGIINFDAHFDLRNPRPQATSGTMFRQILEHCEIHQQECHYIAFGINPSSNTQTLFDYAKKKKITYYSDIDSTIQNIEQLKSSLHRFFSVIDELYLTICLDAFPSSAAPGTSAPANLGIEPRLVLQLIPFIKHCCNNNGINWRVSDIAELNPEYDVDNRTASLAARLINEIVSMR